MQLNSAKNRTASVCRSKRVIENRARVAAQIKRAGQKNLLHFDKRAHLVKAACANAAHHHEVFRAAKASVSLAVLDDARG